jgi:hypothetical protein
LAHRPGAGVNVYVPELLGSTTAGLQLPAIPFNEEPGNDGTGSPTHTEPLLPKLKLGIIFGFMLSVKVVPCTQPPELGVNTYVPECVGSTTEGLHEPEIPFKDVLGNTGTVPVSQIVIDVPNANMGVTLGITVMVTVTGSAQLLAAGVNV